MTRSAPEGFAAAQSASFEGSRVPSVTSWPWARKPAPSVCATSPDPRIPTFIVPPPRRRGATSPLSRDGLSGRRPARSGPPAFASVGVVEPPPPPLAAESFDRSAQVYDGHVAVNRAGARRLVASVPEGRYPRLLDVGCGTGFASLEAIPRLGVERVVGVDASASMLDVFRERLRDFPGVRAELQASDVLHMRVEDAGADLVLCTMALHWFTERAAAIERMARAIAPGGVLGILAPGPAHDRETVALVRATGDPILARLADSIEDNEIDPDVLVAHLAAAGLAPEDVWTETRHRVTTPAAYGARMEAVASHLWSDLPADEQASVLARMYALFGSATDDDGAYRYRFVKTFAIARRGR